MQRLFISINIANETISPEPEVPPKEEIPPKAVEGHQTGNPLTAWLLALMAMVFIPGRRKQ